MRKPRWPGWATIRVRLTAGYVLAFGVLLLLFGAYLHLRLERSLLAQTDAALQVTVSQAFATLDATTYSSLHKAGIDPAMAQRLAQADFAVRLLGPDGTVRDGLGGYRTVPVQVPNAAGYNTVRLGEARWRIYSQPVVARGQTVAWLQAAQSLAPVQAAVESLNRQLLLGLPVALLLAGLGGFLLADRALRPIDRITRTAQAIGARDLSRRIGYQGPADEVGRLAATLDHMLDRLQGAITRERRFTADASHELRTPLTAIKGRIEITLDRPRSGDEYVRTLRELEQEVDRLIRLTTDLLFLARLDQPPLWHPRPLDLSELLDTIVEQLRPLAMIRGVALVGEVPPGLSVAGDLDHLTRLVLNLLDNALKFTPVGGRVTLRAERTGKEIRVAVSDTGPGVAAEHLPHLFDRFYRAEHARSRPAGGSGLGLAIASELARLHGGALELTSASGHGTTVTVRLPPTSIVAPSPSERGANESILSPNSPSS